MDIYTIVNWVTGFLEAYYVFVLCQTFMKQKETYNKCVYLIGVILLGVLINVSNTLFSITLINILVTMFCGVIFTFLFEGKYKNRIILPIITYMISLIMEMLTLLILLVILNQNANNVISDGHFRLMGIFISKVLGYITVKFVNAKFSKNIVGVDAKYWILFAIIFGVTTLILFTFCKVLEELYSIYIRNLIVVCMFGLIVASTMVMILYENTLKQSYMINQNQLSEIRLKEELKHYNDIMMTQGEVKKIKHDLENHLLSIESIVQKQEYDKCIDYIHTLLSNMSNAGSYVDTGNTVLDAIISAKKTEAEKKGISFDLQIRIPSQLPISQEDECIIFGNALDNAIEAAQKVSGKKYIQMSMVLENETLICKIKNSYDGKVSNTTTKSDIKNHGLGRYNINEVLRKYNSIYRTSYENNEYILSIIFMGIYTD